MGSDEIKIGEFKIIKRLGRGGMGAVYEGYDPALDRRVAIKTLTTEAISDEESRGRFEREARAAAKLQHPNIVTIHKLGNFERKDKKPYIVMEHLEGADLANLIGADKNVPLSEALDITIQLCRALDFAHRNGVVHRDVKPSNVRYLDDGRVKIMDFGIARIEGGSQITRSGVMVGTLHYMSPEQIKGESIDGRSDVFSTGCILYEMLAGKRPFLGESATSILYKIVNEKPVPILEANSELPHEIQDILDRALAKNASSRFQTAGELATELEKLLSVYRKSFPRPSADLQSRLGELERLSREKCWSDVIPLAQTLVAERPEMELPQRVLRTAFRELRREEKAREAIPEDETRHLAELSQELTLYTPALQPTVQQEPPEPTAGELKLRTKTGVAPDGTSGARLAKIAAVVLILAGLAVAGWKFGPQIFGPKPLVHLVQISSNPPGSSIFINGEDQGVQTGADGPVELSIEGLEGDLVAIELRQDGYRPVVEEWSLSSERPAPYSPTLEPLTREMEVVTDPPGAGIALDGVELEGFTPTAVELTLVDEHELVITMEGYESRALTIAPEEDLPSSPIVLEQLLKPGTLVVETPYPLSLRTRDGRSLAGTSMRPSASLSVGRHQITLYAAEVFLNRSITVEVREAATTTFTAPALGKMSVRASPGNCKVSISGVSAEAPPFNNKDIVEGSHTFLFEWPDGRRDEQTHEVRPGHPVYVTGQIQ